MRTQRGKNTTLRRFSISFSLLSNLGIFLIILLSSCQTENEKLIGHWHEYLLDSNSSDFKTCFIFTDSTFAVNQYGLGGVFKKEEYGEDYLWSSRFYPKDLIAKKVIKKNEVVFGDTIVWKRQNDNLKTFISDFSAGLKLNIIPFETKDSVLKVVTPKRRVTFLYVGLVKKEYLNKSQEIIEDKYYLQMNDKLESTDAIQSFLMCHNCESGDNDIYIHADQNTPKSFLQKVENEISELGINIKEQVYYLHINKNLKKTGYKKATDTPFIDRLEDSENYTIEISSLGDFTGGKHEVKILIGREKGDYYATFRDIKNKLKQVDLKLIREFELKLMKMDFGDCTTLDTYILKYNKETIQIEDGSCSWNGFNELFSQLFPKYVKRTLE